MRLCLSIFIMFSIISKTSHAQGNPFVACQDEDSKIKLETSTCSNCKENKLGQNKIENLLQPLSPLSFMEKLKAAAIENLQEKINYNDIFLSCTSKPRPAQIMNFSKEEEDIVCDALLTTTLKHIRALMPTMRLTLALMEPKRRESSVTEISSVDLKINKTISHPFLDSKAQNKLSKKEQELAEKIWDLQENQSFIEFKKSQEDKLKNISEPEKSNILRTQYKNLSRGRQDAFNELMKAKYISHVQELPLLLYINNERPSTDELNTAFKKIKKNTENVKSNIEKISIKKPFDESLWLMELTPLVEEILKSEKHFCGVARELFVDFEKKRSTNSIIEGGIVLTASVGCALTGPVGMRLCVLAGGLYGASTVYDAQKIAMNSKGLALNSASGQIPLVDFSTYLDNDNNLKASVLFAVAGVNPVKGAARTTSINRAAVRLRQVQLKKQGINSKIEEMPSEFLKEMADEVLTITDSSKDTWLGKVTANLKTKYNAKVIYDPQVMGPGNKYEAYAIRVPEGASGYNMMAIPNLSSVSPEKVSSVTIHEVVHTKNLHKLFDNQENTPLIINFAPKKPGHSLKAHSYENYLQLDENEAYFKQLLAEKIIMDPKKSKKIPPGIKLYDNSKDVARSINTTSLEYLDSLERAIAAGRYSHNNGVYKALLTHIPDQSGVVEARIPYFTKNSGDSALVKDDLLAHVREAKRKVQYYKDRARELNLY